jgi:hypothetical protein
MSLKKIIINFGSYATIFSVHCGNKIEDQITFEDLDEAIRKQLQDLLLKYKSYPVHILLDTVDQIYKRKNYPAMKRGDLIHLVKREILTDPDKESIKNYLIFENKKISKNQPPSANVNSPRKMEKYWECLFISCSNSKEFSDLVDLVLEMPNRLIGASLLPVEFTNLARKIDNIVFSRSNEAHIDINKKDRSKTSEDKKKSLLCIIIANKAGGVRQIVLSTQGIVFTRVVHYDFRAKDFTEKYEQDIYSTFEYLKRIFPDITIHELNIINILNQSNLDLIRKNSNIELMISDITPAKLANRLGFKNIIEEEDNFCDLIIAKFFTKSKVILDFSTPRIKATEHYFKLLKGVKSFNWLLLAGIVGTSIFLFLSQYKVQYIIDEANRKKNLIVEQFNKIKKTAFDGEEIYENDVPVGIDRVMDFGKINENIAVEKEKFLEIYESLKFLRKFNSKIIGFQYSSRSIQPKSPKNLDDYRISFYGKLFNENGDIEEMFVNFDKITSEIKATFPNHRIKYQELPKNIDFSKKYYDMKLQFSIQKV